MIPITSNTYNIVINPFGKNTSYITQDYVKLINDSPYSGIELLKYIHFHPEHKENHNVKIPNKKQPYAQIYGTALNINLKNINLMSTSIFYIK